MKIGDNIKKYRKNAGLTQKQLGELIDKSTITIRKYESNDITIPIDILNKLAIVLDVPMVLLLGDNSNCDYYTHKSFLTSDYKDEYKKFLSNEENLQRNKTIINANQLKQIFYKLNFHYYIVNEKNIYNGENKDFVNISLPDGTSTRITFNEFTEFINRIYWSIDNEINYLNSSLFECLE